MRYERLPGTLAEWLLNGSSFEAGAGVGGTYAQRAPSKLRKLSTRRRAETLFSAGDAQYRKHVMTTRMHKTARAFTLAVTALTCVVVAGCVEAPPPRPVPRYSQVPPPPQANTDVFAYPQQGQSPEQQDRDRYDCHLWAVKQTGFDPSAPGVPPHDRVRVVSAGPPPGAGTAVGAIAGAILGAAISRPRDAGFGAVAGAIAGGAIGNASDQAQAAANQQVVVQQDSRQAAAVEQKASNYRRAIGACLEARGYSVK